MFEKLSLINELRLMRYNRIHKMVIMIEIIKRKLILRGLDEDKISVIPSGVDVSLFTSTPLPKEPVVLNYGTYQPHRAVPPKSKGLRSSAGQVSRWKIVV
jgi:hypothetical protein